MDGSTDGELGSEPSGEAMMQRWIDAGRVLARLAPHLFASSLYATEATISALSTVREDCNG